MSKRHKKMPVPGVLVAACALGPGSLAVWNVFLAANAEGKVQELLIKLVIVNFMAVMLLFALALAISCPCTRNRVDTVISQCSNCDDESDDQLYDNGLSK